MLELQFCLQRPLLGELPHAGFASELVAKPRLLSLFRSAPHLYLQYRCTERLMTSRSQEVGLGFLVETLDLYVQLALPLIPSPIPQPQLHITSPIYVEGPSPKWLQASWMHYSPQEACCQMWNPIPSPYPPSLQFFPPVPTPTCSAGSVPISGYTGF